MATLEHVPVVDVRHHTTLVSSETWREVARGHVANVHREGKYIVADLHVNDAEAVDAIEDGDRLDISCGYNCERLEWTSGVYEGEPYDCIQRGIKYNHVALCTPGGGRAGPEVSLCLSGSCCVNCDTTDEPAVDVNERTVEIAATVTNARTGMPPTSWTRDDCTPVRFADGTQIGKLRWLEARVDGSLKAVLGLDSSPLASSVLALAAAGMMRAGIVERTERADGGVFVNSVAIVPLGSKSDATIVRRPKVSRACSSPVEVAGSAQRPSHAEIQAALDRADEDVRASAAPRGAIFAQVSGLDQETRSVAVIASTPKPIDGVAITKWDLGRFIKNPIVLWAHDAAALPIGVASDVAFSSESGLTMRVRFATEAANPFAEMVWCGVQEAIVRAVSVGFDFDAETGIAELVEVSFVPIGADEDAGTAAINPDVDDDESPARSGSADEERLSSSCSACGASSDDEGECTQCKNNARARADEKENDDMIENANAINATTLANAWKTPALDEAKPHLDSQEDRFCGVLRLASDAKRASAIRNSLNVDTADDDDEDEETRAFNERVDALERERITRADADERENGNDLIARAKANAKAWAANAWKQTNNGERG